MLRSCFSILLLFMTLWMVPAIAGDSNNYLISQAYFEDTTNSLAIDEVKNEKFTSFDGWFARGYKPSAFWIRLIVRPSSQDLVLRIRPAHIENIELFDFQGNHEKRITGAKHPTSGADNQVFNHSFNLGAAKQEREIYLRVKSSRTYNLHFQVMPRSEFLNTEQATSLLYVGYAVFSLSLALWLLGAWLSNREIVLGLFVIQQFISFLHAFFLLGYARVFFDGFAGPSNINLMTHLIVVGYPLIGILANKFLFKEYSLKRFYSYLFNAGICISIFIIILLITGNTSLALKINALLVIFIAVLFWATALSGTNANKISQNVNLPMNILRVYYTFNLVMWVIVALPVLGVFPSNEVSVHSNYIYSALSGMLFCWILQYRAKTILTNEVLKSAALKEEVESERYRREEQGKLMSMLTHEIRTPLSVLKLVVDRKVTGSELEDFANRAVSNIDSIIDKCIQLDRLELNVLQIHKTKFNFLVLLNSIISDGRLDNRFSFQGQDNINIESDMDIVSIIVSNLVNNAVKYSAPKTDIVIRFEILEDVQPIRLQFSVQNVIGSMGTPDPALAFDKYYRSPAATKVSGSGLGLFLVRELVQALHGEVQLTTEENFIKFTVWIPI